MSCIPHNLISVSTIQKSRLTVIFDIQGLVVKREGKAVIKGKPLNNLIIVDFIMTTSLVNTANKLIMKSGNKD